MKKTTKIYRCFLYILPLVLCFSYFPLIKLGENETMYFELSLPLVWLVVFDAFSLILVLKKYRGQLFTKVFGSTLWWLFPFFATFSVIWSLNHLRGFLTVGVVWALFFAVLCFYELRENLDSKFWKVFWRWFFGAGIFACVWCFVQCFLDIFGVEQGNSLLCDGCVYRMFGFPHPNGFAIEPQFMGNLLLAPTLVSLYFYFQKRERKYLGLFFVFAVTLFLTFSRGAIYACIVGILFMCGFLVFRAVKYKRKEIWGKIGRAAIVFVLSFVFTLNLQGILAASSPTSDTYASGVSKVINQLSLGIIKIEKPEGNSEAAEGNEAAENSENNADNSGNFDDHAGETAVFDGYVAESTDTRVRLFKAALTIWRKDFKTMMAGVGIGGAGQALYENNLSPAPREIVQNEYASLLLETGLIGVSLFIIMIVMAVKTFLKNKNAGLLLSLMVAYAVTLLFFSGLTNALQIVLIPGLMVLMV